MTTSLLSLQEQLPPSIPLMRYTPSRNNFSFKDWKPQSVKTVDDLPPYLILGLIDRQSFRFDSEGWSAQWQGTERDTQFEVNYKAAAGRWEIRQTWCGLDGGYSVYPVTVPLDKVIGQALNTKFPGNWEREAKKRIEQDYQIHVVEQPENLYAFFGIPDGAFRTIAFPVSVRNLRPLVQWLAAVDRELGLPFPVNAEAKLLLQVVNYVEGKAPQWTTQAPINFNQSVKEIALVPYGLPVREAAEDGTAAWTLRRNAYFVFVNVPFAGLTDFLEQMSNSTGPVRRTSDPTLRVELRPVVFPAGFEVQAESVTVWDGERTTRSYIKFAPAEKDKKIATLEDPIEKEKKTSVLISQTEEISKRVVSTVDDIFSNLKSGGKS